MENNAIHKTRIYRAQRQYLPAKKRQELLAALKAVNEESKKQDSECSPLWNHHDLMAFCYWDHTPQGFTFWQDLYWFVDKRKEYGIFFC